MAETTLYIKNMVCNRCIMVVDDLLKQAGLSPLHIELGKAVINSELNDTEREKLRDSLERVGFELIDSKRQRLIEQIKQEIIQLVHYRNSDLKVNLSDYLADKCRTDYSSLSKLFSETTGITIEKYFINQKIERVKELLVYDELSLNEIAESLNYSSTAHLSSQFKSVTGITPSQFKKQKIQHRKPLDEIV
ncbi:AraC family transcriptional regulator [uncultured Bacteroides sp.]|uniref:helix-turn-helix domain-containing protein n=1 Tax=uncultured Bacteroides sp. TaxID=162156 RepID=UPI00260B912C|nr:AraC family transcriptional regulator [uncultured Bacteroides sp.]